MKADLPIVYRKSFAAFAAFPCPAGVLGKLLPHPVLALVKLGLGRGVCIAAVFDHAETSIGPYREVAVGFLVRLRRSGPWPLLPLIAGDLLEDVGVWLHLGAVSTPAARDIGRATWGYPASLADVRVDRTGDRVDCEVIEDGQRILHFSVERTSRSRSFAFPMRTYSALADEIVFTEAHVDAIGDRTRIKGRASLELAEHERTRDLPRDALAKARPIEVRWLDEHRTLLDRPAIRYRASA